MTNKQSLIFTCSIVATTFSLLGWLCISLLSSNKCIYVISMPIIIFIAIVEVYIMIEALERNSNDR